MGAVLLVQGRVAFYTREDTQVLHALIDEYTLCDRGFSSVMGPTWPSRFYIYAGP
jgi:phospholipase C